MSINRVLQHHPNFKSTRSSSVHGGVNHNPSYIQKPKQFAHQLLHRPDLRDSNGMLIKEIIEDEIISIEKDYYTQQRVSRNLELQDMFKKQKQDQQAKEMEEKLLKIQFNKEVTTQKTIQERKKKNEDKIAEFQLRKQHRLEQDKMNLQKRQDLYNKKMDNFAQIQKQREAFKDELKYDYSKFLRAQEKQQLKTEIEQTQSKNIMDQCQERQHKAILQHRRIISERIQRVGNLEEQIIRVNQKHEHQLHNLEDSKLQTVAQRYEKRDKLLLQKKLQDDKTLSELRKKLQEKQDTYIDKKRYMEEEQRQKFLLTQQRKQEQNERTLQRINQLNQEKTMFNREKSNYYQDKVKLMQEEQIENNGQLLYKHITHQRQNQILKEARQKIRDYRLQARFKQNEEQKQRSMSVTYT